MPNSCSAGGDGVGEDAVDAGHRQRERQTGEEANEPQRKIQVRVGRGDDLLHRVHVEEGLVRIDLSDGRADRGDQRSAGIAR